MILNQYLAIRKFVINCTYFFPLGMISLFFGYEYKYFQESDVKDIRPWLVGVLAMTTILSLIGAFKSSIFQLKNIFRRWKSALSMYKYNNLLN